jgi:bifunctional DNA-binding transcriptional regulator/antitoxin component of YhaV-PrlF toxin-antitoxin module
VVPVTTESIIPALRHRLRKAEAPLARSREVHGLPLPRLSVLPGEQPMVYGLAALDHAGRISERGIIRALGWRAGQRLDVTLLLDAVLIRVAVDGLFRVLAKMLLVIPTAVRRWCALSPGDRVLPAADPERGVLVVHPLATVDRLVRMHHEELFGGGAG